MSILRKLDEAILRKDHEKLKLLLRDINFDVINHKINYLCETIIDLAASRGDEVSVELLLAHGAIPDYKRPQHVWSVSTLARAIRSGNHNVIRLLIKHHGCDPDTNFEINNQQEMDRYKKLYYRFFNYWVKVIELNNLQIFQLLLECKDRKISNNEWSQRMLFIACGSGSRAIVEYLLNNGVSIESVDEDNRTGLFFAMEFMHISIIQLLIARGANIKHKDFMGRSLLHVIGDQFNQRQREVVQLLIDNGADINAIDDKGQTPIMSISEKVDVDFDIIWKLLRQPGINLAVSDIYGSTFLHYVVKRNHHNILKHILCQPDVDINARNKFGITALRLINDKNLECLTVLLEFGIDTKDLSYLNRYTMFLINLGQYKLKTIVAGLRNDPNIDTLLNNHNASPTLRCAYYHLFSNEIQRMKETVLFDKFTYYDFLHANKRTCFNVAKRSEIREIFVKFKHGFRSYENMLAKQYLSGFLTPIETEALNSVEQNLDIIFDNKLPSLVIYNIQKYLDIEDMVILKNLAIKIE